MPSETVALRYMTRFRCIGERCEDTCCSGLRVPVSEERLRHMRERLAGTPEEQTLHACMRPGTDGPASIQPREDGHCPFLDGQKMCSLHRRYGESVLPDICSTFPRIVSGWGERWEMAGTLACPEVARLCLLEADAVERVAAPELEVLRPVTARHIPEEALDFAERFRDTAVRLMGLGGFPLSSRLVFLGRLTFVLESLRVEWGVEEDPRLVQALERFEAPAVLESIHRDFDALELPGGACVSLFVSVLKARVPVTRGERFSALVRGVLESFGAEGDGPFDADAAWGAYVERRARLEAGHGERVHQYFHNACVNHWMRSPQGVPTNVFLLALRMALLRFVLLGHPAVVKLCEQGAPLGEEAQAVLDAAAVECFQLMARHVEPAPDFLTFAEGLAGAGGEELLGRTLVFAKFYEGRVKSPRPPGEG
jgi:lysine-N-methylase